MIAHLDGHGLDPRFFWSWKMTPSAEADGGPRSPSTPSYPPGTAGVPLASPPYPPPRMRGEGRAGARRPRSQGVGEGGGAYSTLPAKRIWFFPFPHGREKGGGPASSV